MGKSNSLGNFVRNKRQELNIPGGVSGLARRLGCSVGYMSRIERGNADGPSLKFLQELSHVLAVDVKHLVQMKEQDSATERADQAGSAGAEEGHGEAAAGYVSRYAISNLSGSQKEPNRKEPNWQNGQIKVDKPYLRLELEKVANIHFHVSERLLAEGRAAEASDEQLKALALFELLDEPIKAAFSCFNAGRIDRQIAQDQTLTPVERLHYQMNAGDWFERGYTAFTKLIDKLSNEYRGRRTECLVQWARTDELIGWQLARLHDEKGAAFAVPEARQDLKKAVEAFHFARAQAKRQEAAAQYNDHIARLLLKGEAEKEGWEQSRFLLAEMYHRVGIVYRDLAHVETDLQLGHRHRLECMGAFFEALEIRRELALAFPQDQARTDKHLDRLANTHGEFGNSIQLQQNDPGANEADMREEAYWQFKLAWKLYDILGIGAEEPPMVYVSDHVLGIQQDEGRQSDIISRQRVDNLIATTNFGTREQPSFGYPILYRLANGQESKPVAKPD